MFFGQFLVSSCYWFFCIFSVDVSFTLLLEIASNSFLYAEDVIIAVSPPRRLRCAFRIICGSGIMSDGEIFASVLVDGRCGGVEQFCFIGPGRCSRGLSTEQLKNASFSKTGRGILQCCCFTVSCSKEFGYLKLINSSSWVVPTPSIYFLGVISAQWTHKTDVQWFHSMRALWGRT